MGAGRRSDHIKRVFDVRDPVAEGFIHRILERPAAAFHHPNLGAQQLDAKHVQGLTLHILGAHENFAFEAEACGGSCRGNAVLARARLRNDPFLAHPAGDQNLADGIVDFMSARVAEIFSFEPDLRTTQLITEA